MQVEKSLTITLFEIMPTLPHQYIEVSALDYNSQSALCDDVGITVHTMIEKFQQLKYKSLSTFDRVINYDVYNDESGLYINFVYDTTNGSVDSQLIFEQLTYSIAEGLIPATTTVMLGDKEYGYQFNVI